MRKLIIIAIASLAALVGYYAMWRANLSDDVARIDATIDYHNTQFREKNRWITLKADDVSRTGFPFRSAIRVKRPTLTFVFNNETFGASFPYVDLTPRNSNEGSYDVTYPPVEAVYAKNGQAPEEYKVSGKAIAGVESLQPIPVILRAQGDSKQCSPLPGPQRCPAVAADAPLISYAVKIPSNFIITITLNDESKDVQFTNPIAFDIPVYRTIPTDMDRHLELFVNILREAMIFQKDQKFTQ